MREGEQDVVKRNWADLSLYWEKGINEVGVA